MFDKKKILLSCLLIAAALGSLSIAYSTTLSGAGPSESAIWHTAVCIEKNGELTGPCQHNELTTWGQNTTTDRIFTSVGAAVDYISLSNGTGSGAAIDIDSEIAECGLSRAQATTNTAVSSPESDGNRTLAYTWTNTCNVNVLVNNTGLHNTTAGATDAMFAINNFTSDVTLSLNDQVTVTWYVWVTGS